MRITIATVLVLLSGGIAFAVVGGGDLTIKNAGGNVVLSHDAHVRSASLQCQECHAKIYLNTKKHVTVVMADMEKGKSCGTCHDGTAAFAVKNNCEKCHTQDKAK